VGGAEGMRQPEGQTSRGGLLSRARGGEVQSSAGTPGGSVDMTTGQQTAGVDSGEAGIGQRAEEEPGKRASEAEIQSAQVPCATCRCIASCDGNGT